LHAAGKGQQTGEAENCCRDGSNLAPHAADHRKACFRPPDQPGAVSFDGANAYRPDSAFRLDFALSVDLETPRGFRSLGNGTTLAHSGRSDVGCRRAINQDSHAILVPPGSAAFRTQGWMLIVADGMGAHAAGEEASGMAVERVPRLYQQMIQNTPPDALQRALRQTNAEIYDRGEMHPELKGMGTTCSALVLVPRGVLIGHVGDSRVYRIRGHRIEQLTRDHSLAWECGLPEKEAEGIPKNIITRSMGPHPEVEPDLEGPLPVQNRDIFVLCSDGLSGPVSNAEIGLLASHLPDVDRATKALVGLTLARGAPDNVTVLIAKAGPEEVTTSYAKQEPWPLTDGDEFVASSQEIAWKPLVAAGICFFVSLILRGDLIRPGSAAMEAIVAIGTAVAALATIAFLGYALLASLRSARGGPSGSRAARPGHGSYQEADCAPDKKLLEGIAASIEAAAADLTPADREQLLPLVAQARSGSVSRGFDDALAATATALCLVADAVPRRRAATKASEGDHSGPDRPAGGD
jgi:PPM family protein phosphatase